MEEEIKRFTERLYNETFGNGQGTLDEFDWEDIAMVIEETAHHFVNWQKERQPHWKPSKEQMTNLLRAEGRLRIEGESVLASKLAELYEQFISRN